MTYQQYTAAGHITAIVIGALCVFLWMSMLTDDDCKAHQVWLDGAFNRVPVDERMGKRITVAEYERKCGVCDA